VTVHGILIPRWVAAVFLLGVVFTATLLIASRVNSSSSVRCNQQHACVPAIDSPIVAVRS
jgi:hypothetical protein